MESNTISPMESSQPSVAPASINSAAKPGEAAMDMGSVPSEPCKNNEGKDQKKQARSEEAEKSLPPLSDAEFRAFNQMAERMEYFVSPFLVYR